MKTALEPISSRRTEMSPNTPTESPESHITGLNFSDTELTLRLPGEAARSSTSIGGKSCCIKRGFSATVDLTLGNCIREPRGSTEFTGNSISGTGKSPAAKAQAVGWPPVRTFRKKALVKSSSYVKVGVDGAPYLRKVDLEMYGSYQELLRALEQMFTCFTISRDYIEAGKLVDPVKGKEHVPTYEDKDGDWMLVGDVPWKMFIESCKRIRLIKTTEAIGLAPRTPPNCANAS